MAKEKIQPEKKSTPANKHSVYGFIENVRFGEVPAREGKEAQTAINLRVTSQEVFGGKTQRTFHDIVIFTADKELVKQFEDVRAAIEKKEPQRIGVDGYIRKSGDGFQTVVKPENIELNGKKRTTALNITGNVASIEILPEKNVAKMTIINHFGEGESRIDTPMSVAFFKNDPYGKHGYSALEKGSVEVGDLVNVRGQLHNNNFTPKNAEGKVYTMELSGNSMSLLYKKNGEKVEIKEEPKKAAPKVAEKPAKKPAVSRKKGGMKPA